MSNTNASLKIPVLADLTQMRAEMAKVEAILGTTASAMKTASNAFDGAKVVAAANAAMLAVQNIGGVTKLTETEQAKLNATLTIGLDKYKALGRDAPPAMLEIATKLKEVAAASEAVAAKAEAMAKAEADAAAAAEKAAKAAAAAPAALAASLSAMGGSIKAVGTTMSLAITAPLVAAGAAGLHFAANFEAQMTKVETLAGASKDEVAKMGEAILALAPKVGVGPEELAKGIFVLESAGFKGAEALDALTVAAKMSALGMGETEAISRSLVGVMLSYTKENLTAAQAGDLLIKTVQLGNMKVEELVPSLARVNPLAAAMGIHFSDVAAAMATFTHMGASSEVAATGLRAVLANILNDSAKTEKGFVALQKATGDMSITMADFKARMNSQGLGESLLHLMEQANSAGDKGIEALNKVFPNIKALTEVLAIAGSQAENYKRITNELHTSAGVLDAGFEATRKTFNQQWKELMVQVDVVLIKFGTALLPVFKSVVRVMEDDIVPALQALVDWFGQLPEGVKTTAVAVAGLMAVIGPAVYVIGSFVAAAGEIAKVFALLSSAEAAAGMAGFVGFLANPVVLGAAVVIGGIALAVYELNKNLSDLEHHSSAGQVLQGLKDGAGNALINASAAQSMSLARSGNPDAGGLATGTTLKMSASFKVLAADVNTAATAHQTLIEKVNALTAAERATIEQNMKRESVAALAEDLNLEAKVVAEYERQVRAAHSDSIKSESEHAKALKVLAKAQEDARLAVIPLTLAQKQQVLAYEALKLPLHETAVLTGVADIQIKVFTESLKELDKIRVIESGRGSIIGPIAGQEIVNVRQQLKDITAELTKIHNIESGVALSGPLKGEFLFKPTMHDLDYINDSTKEWEKTLGGVSKILTEMGRAVGGPLGSIMSGVGNIARIGQQTLKDTGSKSSAGWAMAGAAAGYVAQTINTGAGAPTANLVASGALQGAAAGSVVPGWGTAIGAGVGALVGWWQSGAEWRKAFSDISRDFGGLHVPEDFAKTIEQIESDTGLKRAQAITSQLDQLIKFAGGLNPGNLELFAGKLHDAFSYIEQGSMSVAQVSQVLDKTFADFAAAGTDAYGRINDTIREMIDLDQRFGTQSKAITEWMQGQATAMATGLSDLLSQPLIASADAVGKAVADAQAAVDKQKDAIADAVKGSSEWKTATDELAKAQDVLTAALSTQHGESERNKQSLDDLGFAAVTAFNAAIASGQTFAQALQGISPQLSTIEKAYKDLGLAIDDAAIKGLTLENTILNGPGGVGKAIGGLQAIVTAGTNLGKGVETPEAFAAQQRQLASLYTQTQASTAAAGGTTINALLPFQQTLHELQDWANKNKIDLDESTKEKIRQSQELGIWNDDFKTDAEKTRQSIADLIASNDTLAAALGAAARSPWAQGGTPSSGFLPGDDPTGGLIHPPIPIQMASGGFGFASGPMVFSTKGNEEYAFSGEGKRFSRGDDQGQPQTQTIVYSPTYNFSAFKPDNLAEIVEHEVAPQLLGLFEDRVRDYQERLAAVAAQRRRT